MRIHQMRIHHALANTRAGILPSSDPVCDDSVSKLVRNLSYQSHREESHRACLLVSLQVASSSAWQKRCVVDTRPTHSLGKISYIVKPTEVRTLAKRFAIAQALD